MSAPLPDPNHYGPASGLFVTQIPISKILNLLRDRKDRTTKHYYDHETAITNDIRVAGIRNPVKVIPEGEFYRLVCGQTRLNAARRASSLDTVPAVILSGEITPTRLLIEELTDNNMTESFDILAQAEIFIDLMREGGWNQAELCRNVPAAKQTAVSKAMAIFENLIEELKLKIKTSELGPRLGYGLSRLLPDQQLAEYEKVKLMKVQAAEAYLSDSLVASTRKQKPARPVKVSIGDVTIVFGIQDLTKIFSLLSTLVDALKRLEKLGLPLANLQAILKAK
ncbi:ParB/RepB/Spo0J family partition protein [Fimbriiglobus ruber]|uniref:Chromosome (Plasmid) partitioning protein ParB / Stage 0 sporulation protein J n=1 Tax=Fimbriiglobus ruber TaxID=1908690 RepID=A0A225DKG1_9BACT|nr:ParB/Srx family N-terminal domain-containing protein [Fimbriiglobus ruber]OWK41970.1 Chromosome (plasmid) partitioning protein ParB / Stage 0 sporulation protein J [Fimbriiglobus ruber]